MKVININLKKLKATKASRQFSAVKLMRLKAGRGSHVSPLNRSHLLFRFIAFLCHWSGNIIELSVNNLQKINTNLLACHSGIQIIYWIQYTEKLCIHR